ncbi:DUF6461 domain-containing protein [Microbispora sp. H13382]|uniref:DUF6461 domain-containing protein n=1 Tax=Microbispora sp. H13382 TaxID=2729112 RepID=UPI001602B069|nr:DUF6461 domain-containing protein [Microbispora sp. H13382]
MTSGEVSGEQGEAQYDETEESCGHRIPVAPATDETSRHSEGSMILTGDRRATTDVYAWWSQSGWSRAAFCLTFIADLTPEEVLSRLGLTEDPGQEGFATIEVGRAPGGSIMAECGHAGILGDVVHALSQGTSIASVERNVNHHSHFVHAVDGHVVTRLVPMFAHWSDSTDPERLKQDLEELGMLWDFDPDPEAFPPYIEGALALAERRTGVRLEPGHLRPGGLPHRASIARYYESAEGTSPRLARRMKE